MIPLSPPLNYFFTTQHVKYATKGSHKRQRAGVEKEKKCPWANLYIFSMRWARKKKKKKRKASSTQQPQSAGTIALETTQGHFVLLCQLSHSIQKGWREEETLLKSTNEVNETLVCSEGLVSDLRGRFQCLVVSFFRNTTKPWSQMKTRIDEQRWLNSSSAPENLVFQYLLNKHFLVCSIVNKNCLLGCIQVFHDDTRPSLES